MDAISEPQVRFLAEQAIQSIVSVVREEADHPIPVLVQGKYRELEYTGEVYLNESGHELRLAYIRS